LDGPGRGKLAFFEKIYRKIANVVKNEETDMGLPDSDAGSNYVDFQIFALFNVL